MVSLARTVRNIRRVGLRAWWRQMQYIGDAKSGRYVGCDQYVLEFLQGSSRSQAKRCLLYRFNNRYFENMNPEEEVPGTFIRFMASESLIWSILLPP
jgi:NADH dehydrogenase (ubiquinone) 1 alpha subcomplex subunit 12